MAFKSEIHVAELASIRTGHTEGDIYYILDNGMLGDLPCKPGTFVKWHNDTWQIQPDEHYALASAVDGEIAQAIDNILDDGSTSETVVVAVPSSQSSDYAVGNYYEVQGKVVKLRTKTEGDNVTQLTFDTVSGVLEAINNSGKIAVFECSDNRTAQNFFTGPTYAELEAARTAGKTIVLLVHYGFDTVVDRYLEMTYYGFGRGYFDYRFTNPETGAVLQFKGLYSDTETHVWSRASAYDDVLSSTSTNAVQNSTLYAVIGDVETLLAAL